VALLGGARKVSCGRPDILDDAPQIATQIGRNREELQRDGPLEAFIFREPHLPHAAMAEHPDEKIAAEDPSAGGQRVDASKLEADPSLMFLN
jgi:hypothetical protein